MKTKTAPQSSTVPEVIVRLLDITATLQEAINKPRMTPKQKRSLKRQLPAISRLLVDAHGSVLEWFGGSDVWDGMVYLLEDAKKKVAMKK